MGVSIFENGANGRLNRRKPTPRNVGDAGATGDGQTDDYLAIRDASLSQGSVGGIFFPPGTYRVGTNLTINCECIFALGATLEPDAGVTVTLAGPVTTAPGASIIASGAAGTVSIGGPIAGPPILNVKTFGARGDGVTDDTTAVQRAINVAGDNSVVYFPKGVYMVGNITIPNARIALTGDGYGTSSIRALNSALTSTTYLVAATAFVNNSTTGNDPIQVTGLDISGEDLVDYPMLWYGYHAVFERCQFRRPSASGAALRFTDRGVSGANASGPLVENEILFCRLDGGSGAAFSMFSPNARLTDVKAFGNIFSFGNSTFSAMAGHQIIGNHFYAGDVFFNQLSQGTVITGNYFENEVTFDDFKDQIVSASSNRFMERVTVSFGNDGKAMTMTDNVWLGSADVLHNFFAPDKHLIVNGGGFETATPVAFNNGSSTGRVTFNRVYQFTSDLVFSGSRTAAVNSIRAEVPVVPNVSADFGDSSATLVFGTNAPTNRWNTTLSANRTVTLSTTYAISGARFRIVRTGAGNFLLDVGPGLVSLAAGDSCDVEYNGSAWQVVQVVRNGRLGVSTNFGDTSGTLTWGVNAITNRWNTALTADRTVTLNTGSAIAGSRFRIVRTAGGAFNLNVGTGPLKALATNQWCDVEYDGSAWILTAYGTL